jgi:membrane-associated protease RseP (regulator of RpoE activity)
MNFVSYKTFIMVVSLLSMIAQFSLAVGMVNILPIYPLDGGLMFEAVLKKYVKKVRRVQTILSVVTYFLIIVLLFDFIGPWLLGMF